MSIASEITRLQNAKAALKESIEAKGVTVEDNAKLDEYPALVDSIPQGGSGGVEEKDVNFYDYDGTCLYSYTKDEFLALNEMPTLPDHTDKELTSDGWNWDYEDAISYVSKYGLLIIGNVIKPTNCNIIFLVSTSIYNSVNFYLGNCTINWGDGNIETHTTGYANHIYNEKNNYTIKCTSDNEILIGNGSDTLCGNVEQDLRYFIPITGIILGTKVQLSSNCISGIFPYLNFISFPNGFVYGNIDAFFSMSIPLSILIIPKLFSINGRIGYSVNYKIICLSNAIDKINSSQFPGNYNTRKITFPNSCTQIEPGTSAFRQQVKIIIPENVIKLSIPTYSAAIEYYIYPEIPPTLNSYFSRTNNIFKIYVPAESVEAYKAATNWSNYADKIFPIPTE